MWGTHSSKALRMVPMSDDTSTDSFFTARGKIAKQWGRTSGWNESSAAALQAELNKLEIEDDRDEKKDDGGGGGWDIHRVASTFPSASSGSNTGFFEMDKEWEAFPTPSGNDGFSRRNRLEHDSPDSGSKTPTRANTSRVYSFRRSSPFRDRIAEAHFAEQQQKAREAQASALAIRSLEKKPPSSRKTLTM